MVDIFLRSVPADTNPRDVRLYDPTLADSTGPISGTLNQTLGAFTQAATGRLLIQGQASQTIGAFTQVATGRLLIKGQLSQTLGAFTQSATGKLLIKGQAAQTVGEFTQASTGTLLLKAQYNQTLGAFTQTSTATLLIKGQFGQTLGAFTQVATGTQGTPSSINGTADQTLGSFTQAATGTTGVGSLFGWTTHFYSRRRKKKRKAEDVEEFVHTLETKCIDEAPAAIVAQAEKAERVSREYLRSEESDRAALRKALAEINAFYDLVRAEAKRLQDEEEDELEEFLLLDW